MQRARLFAVPAALLALGCRADDPSSLREAGPARWEVSPEPAVVIGGMDARVDHQLERVVDATRLADGRIVVADGGPSELLVYDATGAHLARFGGQGDGPGEMRGLMQVTALGGDTLMVLSFRPGLSWFTSGGEFLDSKRIDFWNEVSVECRMGEGNWYALPDATFLTVLMDNFSPRGCPRRPEGPWRMSGLIARSPLDGTGFDTLAILPGTERNSGNYRVYGKDLVVDFDEEAVYAVDTDGDSISVLDYHGGRVAALPVPFEARPIPPGAKTQDVRRWTDRDGAEHVGEPWDYPEHYPRLARILVDSEGLVWAMEFPTVTEPTVGYQLFRAAAAGPGLEAPRWKALGRDGRVLAEVQTPPGVFPLEIGSDYVLGISEDELDVQSVVVHSLTR